MTNIKGRPLLKCPVAPSQVPLPSKILLRSHLSSSQCLIGRERVKRAGSQVSRPALRCLPVRIRRFAIPFQCTSQPWRRDPSDSSEEKRSRGKRVPYYAKTKEPFLSASTNLWATAPQGPTPSQCPDFTLGFKARESSETRSSVSTAILSPCPVNVSTPEQVGLPGAKPDTATSASAKVLEFSTK